MNDSRRQKLDRRKRKILDRLAPRAWAPQDAPMFTARAIQYELVDRVRGLASACLCVHADRAGSGRCTRWPNGPG